MSRVPTPGYLAEVEASHLLTQALPGAIVLHLKREMEESRPERRMFIELSLGEAVRHWQDVGELIRKAGALERQAPRGETAEDA